MDNKKEIPAGFMKKIRRIEMKTKKLVEEIFSGNYKSVFHGRGLEFEEVREFTQGDDVKYIDWNVSARTQELFVKVFREERELTLFLAVDISGSTDLGSNERSKREIMAEVASILAFSAIRNSDKVGLVLFSDGIEKIVDPRKGKPHVLRIIREILYHEPKSKKTNINACFNFLNNVVRRNSFVFMISDFMDNGYEKNMKIAAQRFDLVPILAIDERELELPNVGVVALEDGETGEVVEVDTSSAQIRELFAEKQKERIFKLKQNFTRAGMDCVELRSKQNYIHALQTFFLKRLERK